MVDRSDPTEGFIAVGQGQASCGRGSRGRGRPFAFLQRYRLDDNPEWQRAIAVALAQGDVQVSGRSAGIDYLIGDQTMTGRGLGRKMIAAFVDLLWDRYPDTTAVVVAVDQGNEASWRALEGAGFLRAWAGVLSSEDPSDEGPSYALRAAPTRRVSSAAPLSDELNRQTPHPVRRGRTHEGDHPVHTESVQPLERLRT